MIRPLLFHFEVDPEAIPSLTTFPKVLQGHIASISTTFDIENQKSNPVFISVLPGLLPVEILVSGMRHPGPHQTWKKTRK